MSGLGFYNYAQGFDVVRGNASAGGYDIAYLYDSAGNDHLVSTPTSTTLSGSGFSNSASYFDSVNVSASAGGYDTADFYDSTGSDDFLGRGTLARMYYGTGPAVRAYYFDLVRIYSSHGGFDHKDVSSVGYAFESYGPWQ
ncbi:MAG TPA: hypothetical protein VEL76_11225 [Gemmataceae bacterium]|nr:hypothetical protein [Gemmataceae bacterium]